MKYFTPSCLISSILLLASCGNITNTYTVRTERGDTVKASADKHLTTGEHVTLYTATATLYHIADHLEPTGCDTINENIVYKVQGVILR